MSETFEEWLEKFDDWCDVPTYQGAEVAWNHQEKKLQAEREKVKELEEKAEIDKKVIKELESLIDMVYSGKYSQQHIDCEINIVLYSIRRIKEGEK